MPRPVTANIAVSTVPPAAALSGGTCWAPVALPKASIEADSVYLNSELHIDGKAIARDALKLEGDLSRAQLQAYRCVFSLGLYGPRCAEAVADILARTPQSDPPAAGWSAHSPGAKAACYAASATVSKAPATRCRDLLLMLPGLLGDDPWKRFSQ